MQVTLRASTLLVGLLLCSQGTATGGLILLPESDPESPATHALSWETHSGRFYLLEESTDLETWTSGEEEPAEGTGGEQRHSFTVEDGARFFRLLVMGEQLLNLPVPEDGTRFDSYAEFEGPRWPKAYGEGHVTLWRGGKFAAYSITIDDNNSPDWPFWLEVADTYGWKLTWFVIVHPYVWDIYNDIPGSNTGYFGTLEEFRLLGEAGHDIQLHGACGAMNTLDAEAYEDHLVRSMQVLEEAVGAPILTYAYPCGSLSSDDGQHDYREIISRHMIGARGTTGGTTPVHLLDYMNTRSLGVNGLVGGEPSTAFARIHDKRSFLYSQYRGWCVTLYHGLDEAGKARTLETLDYVKANEDIFWVAPFTDVAKYAQQRESSTLDISLVQPDRIEFVVTDRMKDLVFDHPLTVKLRLDATWTGVVARQDGVLIEASVVEHEGVPYAYVEAVPDRGRVVLLKAPPGGSAE